MAESNGIGFLGRVPIDTVLVGLLDAVSKGEIPGADSSLEVNGGEPEAQDGVIVSDEDGASRVDFPLLERYNKTTSSKVWKSIAEGVVAGVDKRRSDISTRLAEQSVEPI